MANIALNKPSGGQLILSPEDGTSTETVTVPSGGVMAADAPTGKVLQYKRINLDTDQETATASWVDVANASITITPTSTTSKIIVRGSTHSYIYGGSNWHSVILKVIRDNSVDLGGWNTPDPYMAGTYGVPETMHQPIICREETLGHTNSVTYKLQSFSKNGYSHRANYFSHGYFEVLEVEV